VQEAVLCSRLGKKGERPGIRPKKKGPVPPRKKSVREFREGGGVPSYSVEELLMPGEGKEIDSQGGKFRFSSLRKGRFLS